MQFPAIRGRLRVYLGVAPGAGATCALLSEGHRRAEQGADAVVAVVQTGGRPGIAGMLEGLEIIPPATAASLGAAAGEMDLGAVLARRPQVALVDELAHSNLPDLGHATRWQDVAELLAAGIDVITTVSIGHLDSLADVVEKITGVPAGETVPDPVVRAADEIELVNDGRPTRERVMVGLAGGPEGQALIRRAARIAARSGGDLVAVHSPAPAARRAPLPSRSRPSAS